MWMKKIILAIAGLIITTSAYSGVGQESGNTTCYIYKNNKLAQTVQCKYDYVEGASSSYSFIHVSYTAKAFSKIETSSDSGDITLNEKAAIFQSRHPKTKKIVSNDYAASGKETLNCYKNPKKKFEICTSLGS